MAKKRKKKLKFSSKSLIVVLVVIISLVILTFAGFKICKAIEKRIDEINAEEIRQDNLARHPMKYEEYVDRYSKEYGVPISIVYAVIKTESGFDEKSLSAAGAKGLMQLTDDTVEYVKNKLAIEEEIDAFDPETNIKFGVFYLSNLYERYKNGGFESWNTVLAAYNAGPSNVWSWLADEEITKEGELANIPFPETDNYIDKVNDARKMYLELYDLGE
ncbi:MAG: lytic transglycosylase domain-containing protein [Ruminococcaceae bacterium]|nr:lytic transglycosylase domain-containing protein [Oscillospiraceae bacterium]